MGRQKGQSQRTKGNVRPSSSSRAATLLSDSHRFVGFESMSGDLGYVPMLKSIEDDKEAQIDPDYRVTLGKLSKKDVTTKVKALAEFADLCAAKPCTDTVAILPYWPRIYNKLCDDSDRKVREYSQVAFTSLINSVKKEIAPHLKSIIGPWWVAQSDVHAPTSTAAVKAFTTAFPTIEKQKKALLFCYREIIHNLKCNIFAKTSSSTRGDTAEKERKLSASLSAFAMFLSRLNEDDINENVSESLESICLNSQLYKISKHKSSSVLNAFYSLISAICSSIPDVVASQVPTIAKCVMHKLDESNPLVLKSIWQAVNSLTQSFESWHEYIDIRKGLLPQLWSLIRNGFYGNAKAVSCYLLIFVRRFPITLTVLPVYEELLKNLWISLQLDKVSKSAIETKSLVTTTIELMDIVFQQSLEVSTIDNSTIVDLIWKKHLFPMLKLSVLKRNQNFSTPLHEMCAWCLNNWSLKTNTGKQEYTELFSLIWKDLTAIGKEIIVKAADTVEISYSFTSYVSLLMAIRSASTEKVKPKKAAHKSVKFSDVNQLNADKKVISSGVSSSALLFENLEFCVKECVLLTLESDLDISWKAFVLFMLLKHFSSCTFFKKFDALSDEDSASVFLNQSILPQVRFLQLTDWTRDDCKNIAGIIYFTAIKCQNSVSTIESIFCDFGASKKCTSTMCVFLLQFLVENHNDFVTSDYNWFLNFVLQMVEDLASDCLELRSDKWKVLQAAFSSKTMLKSDGALVILKALNEFLNQHPTNSSVVEVNKIYSICFNTYVDCDVVMDTEKALFRPALFVVLKLLSENAQESLLSSLKNTISTLLKTCYETDSVQTKTFVSQLCCECAAYITSLLFEKPSHLISFDGLIQAVIVIAEELVMHHMRLNFMIEWLDVVLPSSKQWDSLRPSLDCLVWRTCHSAENVFGSKKPNQLVDDSYFPLVQAYVNVAAELGTIFSEAYKEITQHARYQDLFLEVVFAKGIGDPDVCVAFNVSAFKPDFYELLRKLIPNAVTIGSGWQIILSQFADLISNDAWNDDAVITLIFGDDPPHTDSLSQVLKIFVKKSSSVTHLTTILRWSLQKFLENHLDFVESKENVSNAAKSLLMLVSLLEKFKSLQVNESVHLCGDESPLPVHRQLMEIVVEWKSSYPQLFLLDVNMLEAPENYLCMNSAMVKFLNCLINVYPFSIATDEWDFIECSLVSWLESCCITLKQADLSCSSAFVDMLHSVCTFMLSLETFITSPVALSDPALPSSLCSEWNEFFKPAAHASLVLVFNTVGEMKSCLAPLVMEIIGKCLSSITSPSLLSCSSSLETHLTPGSSLPNEVQTLLHHFCSFLLPQSDAGLSLQQTIACTLISKLQKELLVENHTLEPPIQLVQVIQKISAEVSDCISLFERKMSPTPKKNRSDEGDDVSADESDEDEEAQVVETNAEDVIAENSYLYSYLLVWKLMVNLVNFCPSERKSEYIAAFADNPCIEVPNLLSVLTVLLPQFPYILSDDNECEKISMFTQELNLHESQTNGEKMQHLICSLYKDVLCFFPVDVRSWFNGLTKNDRANIEDYTGRHVTPVICKEELDVISKCKPPSGLTVHVRKVAREVIATYEISDTNFEISVQMPSSYPLVPVHVNTINKVGVTSSQWRYWMLQMTMLLQKQNGNILDAFLLWKQKVDKKMDSLEECMICFSIVHGSNARSLPKLQCKTCRKKYHAECLYKWFDTSNQSTCPLCRSPMMF